MQRVSDSVDFAASAANTGLGLGSNAGTGLSGPPPNKTRQVQAAAGVWNWALLSTMQTILQLKRMFLQPTFPSPPTIQLRALKIDLKGVLHLDLSILS